MNILTPTLLTQAMIPKLKNRGKRAAIINMSSLAAKAPGPKAGIFSASKAYNLNFSVSLHDELRENVDVLAVLPGYLETPQTVGMRH
jgi:short-subunit dehydrogenase